MAACTHVPVALHVPPQAPTSHDVPVVATGFEQPPVPPSPTLHVPTTWQESDAVHVSGGPPAQVPLWHESAVVQGLPSLHVVPFDAVGFEQVPVLGAQVPAAWH